MLALWSSNTPQHAFRYALIVVLSLATGVQNASIRKLAVPDLTTTVLTMTVTGIGADSVLGGGKGSKSGRRLVAVAAMFLGALLGAFLVLHVRIVVPLAIALVVIAWSGWPPTRQARPIHHGRGWRAASSASRCALSSEPPCPTGAARQTSNE